MRRTGRTVGALLVIVMLLQLRVAPPVAATGAGPARPPVPGDLLRPFSPPTTPYGPGHRGVDLAAAPGVRVTAPLAGRVAFSGTVAGVGWVTVDHGGGLDTTYGPVEPRFVAAGQRVTAGAALGRLAPTSSHLDWGARLHGSYIDPLGLLGSWQLHLVSADAEIPSRPAGADPRSPPPPEGSRGRLVWPVRGRVSSGFGIRRHPVSGRTRGHNGVDIAAPVGATVAAAADGRVVQAGPAGGYGLLVVMDHGSGLSTRYAHLSRVEVRIGQQVRAGQRIGAVGSTGISTGPHLHFETRLDGVARDPRSQLP